MSLCTLEDINKHLPDDKLQLLNAQDEPYQLTAERVIKGYLSGTFTPATLATWLTPETTPDLIQEIAGKYIAAIYYRLRLSETYPEFTNYLKTVYDEAVDMLISVRNGELVLMDLGTGVVVTPTGRLSAASFFPNDAAPEPVFSMDLDFG